MAGRLIIEAAQPALDSNGNLINGSTLEFYDSVTLLAKNVFSSAALTTSLGNTVTASGGFFPEMWADDGDSYRVVWKNASGSTLRTMDNIIAQNNDGGTYKASTAATTRSVGARLSDFQHLTDFGAVPGVATVEQRALNRQALVNAAATERLIIVPDGDFYFDSRVDVTDKAFNLVGGSRDTSRLIWNGASGGIRVFDNSGGTSRATAKLHSVRGVSLMTEAGGGGQPLYIRPSGYSEPSILLEHVTVCGFDDTNDWWTDPVQYQNAVDTRTLDLKVDGRQNNFTAGQTMSGALKIAQDPGVGAMVHFIRDAHWKFFSGSGFEADFDSSTGTGIEGISIIKAIILANTCVKVKSIGTYVPPFLNLISCELDPYTGSALDVERFAQIICSNTLFAGDAAASITPLIRLHDVIDAEINGGFIQDYQTSPARQRTGIAVSGTSTRVTLSPTKIDNFDVGISVGASCVDVVIDRNIDFVDVNTPVSNSAASTVIESNSNNITLSATPTGSPPNIRVTGADTNSNLLLTGKGTGFVLARPLLQVDNGASAFLALDGAAGRFRLNDGAQEIAWEASGVQKAVIAQISGGIEFRVAGGGTIANNMYMDKSTFRPSVDNTLDLGSGSFRYDTVFAGTGTINTSDQAEKTPLRQLSPAEIAVGRGLLNKVGVFQWLASIQEKGDAARLHVGVIAQEVEALFAENGLDAWRYGAMCSDPIFEVDPDDENGIMTRPVIDHATGEQKTRLGVRTDQLLWLALGALGAE